ncbi:hypothetical protein C8F01DRAFT_1251016 [Mycena amicta]|nr:hypothetical protein C8F01DRAFT_1251016 [Mycena amicta]
MDAPRLQKLALASSLPFNFPFPNSQLCELHLGAAATLDMFQFMEQCSWPCLTTLILNPFYPLKFRGASAHIPLTQLKTLVLAIRDGYSRNPIIDVLDILATPALENLEVWGLREILIPRQSFASFIERSNCTMTSLRLTFKDNVPVPNLLSNFRTLAMLSHLAIFALGSDAMNPTAKVLSALISSADAESLLPHLVDLELQTTSFLPVLMDMVESRLASRANCTRLERLACHNAAPPTEYQRLTAFTARGLTILWPPRHRPAKSHVFIQ